MIQKKHVVNICNQTKCTSIDQDRLQQGICLVLQEHRVARAIIGLAIVTDDTIHKMNRQYLKHDYTTDVLSFPLSSPEAPVLEGEIAISFETAKHRATEYHWRTEDELLLYAIHGALHLVGFSDHSQEEQAEMRDCEKKILEKMNLVPAKDTTPRLKSAEHQVTTKPNCSSPPSWNATNQS